MDRRLGRPAPLPWTNQVLTLYHGTVDADVQSILREVKAHLGRAHTDFGQGFYTTTIERQARSWAWQLSRRRSGTRPAVIRFDVDRENLAQLECLWFVRGSVEADDFWSLVHHCRTGGIAHNRIASQGWYDVVSGPVAASWRRRITILDADQVSFHTVRAVQALDASNPREI